MKATEFVTRVQQYGNMGTAEQALLASRATLETLGERLNEGEPARLGAQLPPEIAQYLHTDHAGEDFPVETFFDRVTEREGTERQQAREHARAVIAALGDTVPEGELNEVRQQLSADYQLLFGDIGQQV